MGKKQKEKDFILDGLGKSKRISEITDFNAFRKATEGDFSVLFSKKYGATKKFFTKDSGLYYTPEEYRRIQGGGKVLRVTGRLDSLTYRNSHLNKIYSIGQKDIIYLEIRRRYASMRNYWVDLLRGATQGVSAARMWNLSIVGAVIFGMFTMTMVYRYLGQNVSAKIEETRGGNKSQTMSVEMGEYSVNGKVLGANDSDVNSEIDDEYITKLLEDYGDKKGGESEFEKKIKEMVKGYPIEKMVPEIVKKDRIVAAFLISIAKKESNWGKRVPVLNGQDCFNYWGYRGKRARMGTGGHTCFDSPKDAVETVGKRIEYLVSETNRTTPDKMVVWKCGYDCSWDNKVAVRKWISDVDLYFKKLNEE